jgi:hypothetical protein
VGMLRNSVWMKTRKIITVPINSKAQSVWIILQSFIYFRYQNRYRRNWFQKRVFEGFAWFEIFFHFSLVESEVSIIRVLAFSATSDPIWFHKSRKLLENQPTSVIESFSDR